MDQKPNDRFDHMELSDTPKEPLEESSNSMKDVSKITTLSLLDTQELHRSGRIVRSPNQFMILGELSLLNLIWILVATTRLFLTKIQKIGKVL